MLRVWAATLCLALAAAAPKQAATPYSVDDLIALENLGQVIIDPAERLVIVERRRPHDGATDYSYGPFETRALSNIYVASLTHPHGLAPLFAQASGAGYWTGSFSPSGKRLSVFRLANRQLHVGIVDMATRHVTWLDVIPDLPIAHPAPSWVGDDTLVIVTRRGLRLPLVLSIGNALQTDLARLWADAERGDVPSSTVVSTNSVSADAGDQQVVRIDLMTGRHTLLATSDITDIAVSKRGDVAIVSTVGPVRPPLDAAITPDFVSLRHVIDIVSGDRHSQPIRIADDVLPATMAWDDTGRRLAFVSRMGGRDWAHARYQVATLDPDGRSVVNKVQTIDVEPVIEGKQSSLIAHLRWAGPHLLVEASSTDMRSGWFAIDMDRQRPSPRPLGSGSLVFADARSAWLRAANSVTETALSHRQTGNVLGGVVATGIVPLDPSSTGVRLLDNPVAPTTVVVTSRSGTRHVTVIDDRGVSRIPIIIPDAGKVLAVGRHHVVWFAEDAHGIGTLAVSDRSSSAVLARTNEFLGARAVPKRIEIKSMSSDGSVHSHWLFLPPNRGSAPPPLVAVVYPGMILDGGADPASLPSFFLQPNNISILVGHGFAVLTPSLPAVGNGSDPLGVLAKDLDSAVDATLARHLVDPNRVAMLGHSYGAFGALAVGTRSTRYRGIVAVSGPYDLAAVHGAMTGPDRIRLEFGLPLRQDAGWAEGGQAMIDVAPWTDPDRYVRKSPAYSLDRVRTPILLIHGETDVVSLEQAERAFMGLARLGQDATLIRYWGEGHVLTSPANIRDYWRRVLGWLDERLAVIQPGTPVAASPKGASPTTIAPIPRHQSAVQ